MQIVKMILFGCIVGASSYIGILYSQKYTNRVKELKEIKTALNMFATKIKFTYESIPQIFTQIAGKEQGNVSRLFALAAQKMENKDAGSAWCESLEENQMNILQEDKEVLKGMSHLLGKVDLEGQVQDITLVDTFLDTQIEKAEEESKKNTKLYKTLGVTAGMTIAIMMV